MEDHLTIEERRKASALHLAAVAAERRARFSAWLEAVWKPVAALPCALRIQKSVERPHQKRGVSQAHRHQPVLARSVKRGKRVYPLWAYTPARLVIPLRKPAAIGKPPPRGSNPRLRQAGQGLIEYSLLMVAIVALVLVVAMVFGAQIGAFLQHLYTTLGGI